MDPTALQGLAAASAAGVVEAMTTEAWNTIRSRVAKLIGKGSTDKEQQVVNQLEESRTKIRLSADASCGLAVRQSEIERWTAMLRAVLDANPSLAEDFSGVLELAKQAIGSSAGTVTQNIAARRDAYAAGKDQYIRIYRSDADEH